MSSSESSNTTDDGQGLTEDELMEKLSQALQIEELKKDTEESKNENSTDFPKKESLEEVSKWIRMVEENNPNSEDQQTSEESISNDFDTNQKDENTIQNINKKLDRLQNDLTRKTQEDNQWKRKMETRINKLAECVGSQAEALISLENVVNKEIQSRISGETRSQTFYNVLSQQMAAHMQMQAQLHHTVYHSKIALLSNLINNNGEEAKSK
eukprot:gb/GECH01008615.1/.p1 GENE.gb/GECH01008615.1/~~gb/GECH01008615.1/.p1  ORF type:complete len:211 (+),score=53.48 gb/GECH01008615.1/:1-633(+)